MKLSKYFLFIAVWILEERGESSGRKPQRVETIMCWPWRMDLVRIG